MMNEYERLFRSVERLAKDWQNEADRANRDGFKTYLDPRSAAAVLRNRLADVRNPAPTPYICRHGKTEFEHWCDDLADHDRATSTPPAQGGA